MYERSENRKRYASILLVTTLVVIAFITLSFISKEEGAGFLVELVQAPEQSVNALLA